MKENIAVSGDDISHRIESYVLMARQLSKMLLYEVYVMDFRDNTLLYISDHLKSIYRKSDEYFRRKGLSALFENVYPNELELLKVCREDITEGLAKIGSSEMVEWCIILNLHYVLNGKRMMLCDKMMVLEYDECQLPMIGLGIWVPMMNGSDGDMYIGAFSNSIVYEYSIVDKRWTKMKLPTLSADEKILLTLAMSGYSVEKIASTMCKSVDTIKFYRKQVFVKLGARNISEAISKATTYCLL